MPTTKHKKRRDAGYAKGGGPLFEELESRLLLSADLSAVVDAAPATEPAVIQQIDVEPSESAPTEASAAEETRKELVLIDPRVDGYGDIVADLLGPRSDNRQIEVLVLDPERDGIQQVNEALAERNDLSALHVISHGVTGEFRLGGTQLNFESLLANATAIQQWGNALTDDADIMLYGCNIGATADGQQLIDALGRLTGADVAASNDPTGHISLGGDWSLEVASGTIDTGVAPSANLQASWENVLAFTAQGGETRVNSTTANTQETLYQSRQVAMDSSGNYVVVWNSDLQDGSGWGVYAQRYNAAGVAQGSEFRVNTTTSNSQSNSAVAMDASGNFVVVWDSVSASKGVYAQRYNAAGVAQGGEFLVNTTTANDQEFPVIAMNASGNFVIMWESDLQDGSGDGVYAQRYNAAGVAQGSEFRVNTTTANSQRYCGIAMDDSGNFVAIWGSNLQDGSGNGVYAQRYNAAGVAQGGEFRVNTTTAGDQGYHTVSMDANGNFIVVWNSDGQDGSGRGIFAQRYNAAGVAQGGEFQINSTTSGNQEYALVTMRASGFVVVWQSALQDGSGTGIYLRQFDAAGNALTGETLVNTTTTGDQRNPSVALDDGGRVVVVWSGNGSGDAAGVFMQRYTYTVPPVITSNGAGATAAVSMAERNTPVTTVTATDADGGALTYSIAGGADAALFRISASTGALRFNVAPDFETPADAGADNIYDVTVRVTDSTGYTDTQALAITVTNVNEAPTGGGLHSYYEDFQGYGIISPSAGNVLQAGDWVAAAGNEIEIQTQNTYFSDGNTTNLVMEVEGTGGAIRSVYRDFATTTGETFLLSVSYSIRPSSPLDSHLEVFWEGTSLGILNAAVAGFNTYTFNVTANSVSGTSRLEFTSLDTDGNGGLLDIVSLQRTDGPSVITNEDTPRVFTVADFSFNDPDAGDSLNAVRIDTLPGVGSLTLSGVAVTAGQIIVAADITAGNLVFTPAANANGNAYASFTFSVRDQSSVFDAMANPMIVHVTPVNDAPVLDNTKTPTLNAVGEDAGAPSGAVGTLISSLVDFAAPAGQVDNVTDVDSAASLGIAITAADTANGTWWYSTNGGTSWNALGAVNNTNARLLAANASTRLYFEPAANYNGTVANAVTFRAWDQTSGANGSLADTSSNGGITAFSSATDSAAITVTAVNDAPAITSNGGGANAAVSIAENITAVTTVVATDIDVPADTLTYSIVGGADAALFRIGSSSGNLRFNAAQSFETPADVGADNVYNVTVQVSDGNGGTDTQAIAVTITNVNEAPTGGGAHNYYDDFQSYGVISNSAGNVYQAGEWIVGAGNEIEIQDEDNYIGSGNTTNLVLEVEGPTGGDRVYRDFATTTGEDFVLSVDYSFRTGSPFDSQIDVYWEGALITTLNAATIGLQTYSFNVTANSVSGTSRLEFRSLDTDGTGGVIDNVSLKCIDNPTITTNEDTAHIFSVADFSFNDSDAGDSLSAVRIDTLPAAGSLTLSGVAVTAGQVIAAANISAGNLVFTPAANASGSPYTTFTFSVRDQSGLYDQVANILTINVTSVNDAPTITSNGGGANASISVTENTTAVTTVTATDVDVPADTLSYSIVGGADAALFTINSSTGALSFLVAPNFESPTDAGANNVYDITVQVSDGNGGSDTQAIAVTVTDTNEAPVITSNGGGATASVSVIENTTAVTTVTATDVDAAQILTYSISGGADAALFSINSSTGALTFLAAPNFESPTDAGANNIYDVTVQVSDGNGGSDTQAISVTVTDTNEAPAGADATVTISEDASHIFVAANFGFTDPDAGDSLSAVRIDTLPASGTLTLSGVAVTAGQVIAAANITAGNLVFTPAANASGSPYASFTFSVRDQSAVYDASPNTLTVNVTSVNDAPAITSNGGGANAAVSVAENTTAVTTVTATDIDVPADTLTYSISGGADAALFSVNSSTGALSFAVAPDFEAPGDVGGNNVYDVTVQVSDGNGGIDTQAIAVTVTDANELPTITSNGGGANAAVSVAENTTTVTTVTATDTDIPAQTLTYSLVGGADSALFSINSSTGVLTFSAAPNFESPGDVGADNIYNVTVQVSDGNGGSDTQAIAVTVTNANEAPAGADATVTINEDASHTFIAANFGFTDPDAGDSLSAVRIDTLPAAGSLTLSGVAVTAGQIIVVADITAGNLVFTPAANANGSPYASFTFSVRDQSAVYDASPNTIAVNVTAINDAPAITSNGGGAAAAVSIAENTTAVTTVTAADIDLAMGETLTYSIVGGADAARFTINAATGALSFNAAPNFESPTDVGTDNVYDITVQVADASGAIDAQTIAVTITNVNDAPVISTNNGLTLSGTGSASATLTPAELEAIDDDNAAAQLTFTLTAVPSGGVLQLNGVTLAVNDSFTQADLNANRVTYVHTDPSVFSTSFGFAITDGAGGSAGPSSFAITATVIPPPPGPIIPPPPPPPPPGGGPPPPPPGGTPPPPPISGGGSADPVPYVSYGIPSAKPIIVAPVTPGLVQTAQTIVSDAADFIRAETQFHTPAKKSLEALGRALDNLRKDMNENTTLSLRVASAPTISGAILTVGFVSWLLRSGALVSSLMATAPLWNRLDPVPILAGRRRDKERDEDLKERVAAARDRRERAVRKVFQDGPGTPAKGESA